MPLVSHLLSMSYDERVVHETEDWQIRFCCRRGYDPYFTLHERRKIFSLCWWSEMKSMAMTEKQLRDRIAKWEDWPVEYKSDF